MEEMRELGWLDVACMEEEGMCSWCLAEGGGAPVDWQAVVSLGTELLLVHPQDKDV